MQRVDDPSRELVRRVDLVRGRAEGQGSTWLGLGLRIKGRPDWVMVEGQGLRVEGLTLPLPLPLALPLPLPLPRACPT